MASKENIADNMEKFSLKVIDTRNKWKSSQIYIDVIPRRVYVWVPRGK